MNDRKIHIPRKTIRKNDQGVIRISTDAMDCLAEVANDTGMNIKQIASTIITQAVTKGLIIYDMEDY